MTAVAELDEAELSARLAEIDAGIRRGDTDVEILLEEREVTKRKLEAARILKERRADEAYLADVRAKSAEFRGRLMPVAERVADNVPRLLWDLKKLERMDLESLQGVGNVNFEEETGIPFGFAAQLHRAIMELSIGIEWHFDHIDAPDKTNPLPTPKQIRLAMPAFRNQT
ncbi:MAG: hypothetical protein H0T48_12555 [Gemmatimonadaceae bacterium]|nr:hypothetical protein [Gemmatimonadaceae bacterium]